MSEFVKPTNCTCAYPEIIVRNMNGHSEDCPVYVAWAESLNPKRSKAHPVTVALDVCPGCGLYGVPRESNRPFKFCLRCQWTDRPVVSFDGGRDILPPLPHEQGEKA